MNRPPVAVYALGLILAALTIPWAGSGQPLDPGVTPQVSGSDALFIGISPVSASVVWIAGTGGTYGRTMDGGDTWVTGVVPGADSLQFRDVHAVDAEIAYLLSIGSGDQSRIYKTEDGGASWMLQFVNAEPEGFFDCFDFWDDHHGLAFSDSYEGSFYLIQTADGGRSWERIPNTQLPPARPGEGSFAASGHCLHVHGDSSAWVGTGASEGGVARVLRTTDRGATWSVHDTAFPQGAVSGITSVAFADPLRGAVLGGDVADMESKANNVALTTDGGITWKLVQRPGFTGPVYGATYVPGAPVRTLVAVGPQGVAYTTNDGEAWSTLTSANHWSVGFAGPEAGWAIGTEGRITKLTLFR